MAARRAFGVRRELMNRVVLRPAYYPPAGVLRRVSTNQAKSSSGVGGLLLRTLTLAGAGGACAVAALEKVPGLQDSIEQVAPGFKDRYSQTRLATISWYKKNFERASKPMDPITKEVKGVEKSSPLEPPPVQSKVPKPKETPSASATRTTKESSHMELKSAKDPEVTSSTVAEVRQPPTSEVGSQAVTRESTKGSEKKREEVKPAMKEDPVNQEHAPSKAKTAEEPKQVNKTTHDSKLPPKLQPPPESIQGGSAEVKGTATGGRHREVEEALDSALKGFTTAAELAVVTHHQTYAQSLGSALSSMEDVGASSVGQLAAKEQAALAENRHADVLKEYNMQKSNLERAIVSAKEFGFDKAVEAEKTLRELDSSISALEHAMDLARASSKEHAVLQGQPSPSDVPPPSSDSPQSKELALLQGMLDASRGESETLVGKVKELESQLEAALRLQSAEVEAKVAVEVDKETHAHKAELEKQATEYELWYEEKLREQLRRQIIAQEEQMEQELLQQSQQLNDRWLHEMERQLKDQGTRHQTELARTKAHLQAVDCMIESISDAGKEVSKQQTLRATCETLYKALEAVDMQNNTDELHKFEREVAALKEAAKDSKFVTTVLTGIPEEAVTGEGIYSAAALVERFKKVKRVCRHVALVPAEGGGIGTHIASVVASGLSFRLIPRHMMDANTPLEEMDTYGLLEQADAYLHHGDLDMAVRCMNQLCGEPRRMASDWISDTRLYLETKQAVTVIRDHVAASSVSLL